MKNNRTFLTLTLLLTIISAGFMPAPLMAQTADPFGQVNDSTYQNTMTITGHVRLVTKSNGQWVPVDDKVLGNETVVAVYCGDELRGKGSPADYNNKYFSLLMITVYGESKDKLYFKVLTDGHVIEFAPEDFTFTTDLRLGKAKEPYYIDLPAPVNTTFSTEGYATTCLPFDARVPNGITLYDATGIEDGDLVMEEVKASVLPKDTPVLLKVDGETTYEWLSAVIDDENLNVAKEQWAKDNGQSSILKGTTEPTGVTANSVLTLGHSKETGDIGFWLFTGTEIPANRAYIADFLAGSRGARIIIEDSTTTGISEIVNSKWSNSKWYDLQGRRLNAETYSSPLSPLKRMWKKNAQGQIIIIR